MSYNMNCQAFNKDHIPPTSELAWCTIHDSSFYRSNLMLFDFGNSFVHRCVFFECDFTSSNFVRSDLRHCIFYKCRFFGSRFDEAVTRDCSFVYCNFEGVCNPPDVPLSCPESGEFIGWKKAHINHLTETDCGFRVDIEPCIVKLRILPYSKRSSAYGRKCRCDKALVLEIQSLMGEVLDGEVATSMRDMEFHYRAGEVVSVPNFDENPHHECAPGIHFFITRKEAVDY